MAPYKPVEQRILDKIVVDPKTRCWLWQGTINRLGYAQIKAKCSDGKSRTRTCHRVAYETFVGPIPEGMTLDHGCRVRNCVNPDHLTPMTQGENVLRSPDQPAAINARKTHCKRGHKFTPANTYPNGRNKTGRGCIACRNLRNAGQI